MRYKSIGLAVFAALLALAPISASAAEIPLRMSGGIYTVPAEVNRSVTLEFLVDPGAGVVVIPTSVLRQLIQNGTVTQNDILGAGTAETADRSLYLTATVRLRELRLGNTVVRDVTAAVSPGLTQPLLGQSLFRRFAYVTFDNRRQMLILPDELAAPVAQAPGPTWIAPYASYSATGTAGGGTYNPPAYNPPAYYPGYGR